MFPLQNLARKELIALTPAYHVWYSVPLLSAMVLCIIIVRPHHKGGAGERT